VSAGGTGTKVVDTASAEHYTWGGVCDGWHLVRSSGFSVIEERMPPGAQEQRHFHRRARQFFYVLAGELVMEIEGALHKIERGQGLEIAPGVAHQARNESNETVRFLVMSEPPSHLDRVASDKS
jgi:mannose-6-phosphate isomerase-like protein (cupin superfamily)